MELRTDPSWSTRPKRRKFVAKVLKHHFKYLEEKAKSPSERTDGKAFLVETRTNMMKIISRPTRWEPAPTTFNLPFLKETLKDVKHGLEVLDFLENGITMSIEPEEVEEKAKQNFKQHTCFRNPLAVLNWTKETLKELEKVDVKATNTDDTAFLGVS